LTQVKEQFLKWVIIILSNINNNPKEEFMSMFCYQCQETVKNQGCTIRGVCGKTEETSNLQDLLIYTLKGISVYGAELSRKGTLEKDTGRFIVRALFATITNANFDSARIADLIKNAIAVRDDLGKKNGNIKSPVHDSASWIGNNINDYNAKAGNIGLLSIRNEDVRSLQSLLIYGLMGIAAYADHAYVLGYEDDSIYSFIVEALESTTKDLVTDEMVNWVLKAGEAAVKTMALLDTANTKSYGNPELTKVNIGVRNNPGILISGHDLKDMQELLEATDGTGVDVYTHGEMLPANYYPAFKKFKHFVGNYGGSWWHQDKEFESFNGPILMTTNCITPVKDSYKDRIFTTGLAGYPGVKYITDRKLNSKKDFSQIVAMAKNCKAPVEIEKGEIVGGFAHDQIFKLADKIVDAVKSGAIKRFVVMAGCDGRQKTRSYFTDVAENLPDGTVILTAGCAKYRYNKLQLGDIGGIPRVIDAGQCNDSYSLAVVALKLKEIFNAKDINELPISFDIAWYEQKAVAVLLALLSLGVKGIRLGPTLPAFLSPNVAKVLVENFSIKLTGEVKQDIDAMMAGK
jgi:hydroxylamine reductase